MNIFTYMSKLVSSKNKKKEKEEKAKEIKFSLVCYIEALKKGTQGELGKTEKLLRKKGEKQADLVGLHQLLLVQRKDLTAVGKLARKIEDTDWLISSYSRPRNDVVNELRDRINQKNGEWADIDFRDLTML